MTDHIVVSNRRVTVVRRTAKRRAWLIEWWDGLLIVSAPTWLLNLHVHRWTEAKR